MGGESKMVGIVVGRYRDGERETLRWVGIKREEVGMVQKRG